MASGFRGGGVLRFVGGAGGEEQGEDEPEQTDADVAADAEPATHVAGGPDVDVAEADVGEADGDNDAEAAVADDDAETADLDAGPVTEDEAPAAGTEADGDAVTQGVGVVVVGCVAPRAPTVIRTGMVPAPMAATRTATVRGIVRRA